VPQLLRQPSTDAVEELKRNLLLKKKQIQFKGETVNVNDLGREEIVITTKTGLKRKTIWDKPS
jgi:hypothetical protein